MAVRKGSNSRDAGNGPQSDSAAPSAERDDEDRKARRRVQSAWPERSAVPVNSVSVGRSRAPEVERAGARRSSDPRSKSLDETASDSKTDVPLHIREKYVQVGSRFHFPDGDQAFKVGRTGTTTRLDTPEVVRDIIEIEAARSDGAPLQLRGTKKFRAEAWRQAALLGVEVEGYRPSRLERAQLEREQFLEAAKTSRAGRVSIATNSPDREPGQRATAEAESPPSVRAGPEREPPIGRERSQFRGRLVAHGAAPYQHDRHNEMSYFVKLETRDGEKTVWGKDLERAIKESLSAVKRDDRVVIRHAGETAVTVKRHGVDADGNKRTTEEVQAFRNRWIVETQSLMNERAELARVVRDRNITPQEAVKRHPSLAGVYLNIQAAHAVAKDDYKSQSARRAFVDRVRNEIADEVARGEKLPAAQLREQTSVQLRTAAQNRVRERAQLQERTVN